MVIGGSFDSWLKSAADPDLTTSQANLQNRWMYTTLRTFRSVGFCASIAEGSFYGGDNDVGLL
jgi:hypothetical protein